MQLILCDLNEEFIQAAKEAFAGDENVGFVQGDFRRTDGADCIVSAANSFGIMDGGIDLALSEYFGWGLETQVQKYINREYLGQQPIGTAFLLSVDDDRFNYLCHAPTMRIPKNTEDTENVYNAMWAIIYTCHKAKLESVMCCGLGTGAGAVDSEVAAGQMALAWQHYRLRRQNVDWQKAREIDLAIQRSI